MRDGILLMFTHCPYYLKAVSLSKLTRIGNFQNLYDKCLNFVFVVRFFLFFFFFYEG